MGGGVKGYHEAQERTQRITNHECAMLAACLTRDLPRLGRQGALYKTQRHEEGIPTKERP